MESRRGKEGELTQTERKKGHSIDYKGFSAEPSLQYLKTCFYDGGYTLVTLVQAYWRVSYIYHCKRSEGRLGNSLDQKPA